MIITDVEFNQMAHQLLGFDVDLKNVSINDIQAMIEKKQNMEKELLGLSDILKQENIGLEEPLVDKELYPRADIDIPKVLDARIKIIRLKNDLKAVVSMVAKAQEVFFEQIPPERRHLREPVIDISHMKPVAMVKHVDAGSPSDRAGIRPGDQIVQFGDITAENFSSLANINNVTQKSKGLCVKVVLLRDGKRVRVNLIPKEWSGKGLLGCMIVPLS